MKHYEAKFGAAKVRSMIPHMKAVAGEHGIQMEYGGHVGNTFDSHRLIWKAREVGGSELQDKVVEQVFQAYFEENKSLGEQAVLEECASKAGLAQSSDFLSNSELGAREVRGEMQEYGRAFQCTGVPMFVVDGKFTLSGAQESDAFLRLFGKL
mmetsp:Transcript_9775/g.17596  ORF Transcript_9775/g.17596 Transcript_9775/m.17596 type:complete len:153 (+) Transcript_9775:417-875(+)|eukprot:CAMPEP_0201867808 /NCGR_PEP_ID=MMETSP0902-20130614/1923_1 /ASSEMBLY_ACC=CAM_ASM_000551 /TAXON_ID=420261 /ORGANISM="Thalassiosira antarctica, Strain CCMP982" /LENGTH=152 /DNA_ID=CAMNT_0048393041 /DNA_START=369 /DNA_END=827 /DNA_ORIENTATION=+